MEFSVAAKCRDLYKTTFERLVRAYNKAKAYCNLCNFLKFIQKNNFLFNIYVSKRSQG